MFQSIRSIFQKVKAWGRSKKRSKSSEALSIPDEIQSVYQEWNQNFQNAIRDLKKGAEQLGQVESSARSIKRALIVLNQELEALDEIILEDTLDDVDKREHAKLKDKMLQEKAHAQIEYLETALISMDLLYNQEIVGQFLTKATENLIVTTANKEYQRSPKNDRYMADMINKTRTVLGAMDALNRYVGDVKHIILTNFIEKFEQNRTALDEYTRNKAEFITDDSKEHKDVADNLQRAVVKKTKSKNRVKFSESFHEQTDDTESIEPEGKEVAVVPESLTDHLEGTTKDDISTAEENQRALCEALQKRFENIKFDQ